MAAVLKHELDDQHADQVAAIIVETGADGRVTRVRDVARIELGARDYTVNSYLDNQPAVAISTAAADAASSLRFIIVPLLIALGLAGGHGPAPPLLGVPAPRCSTSCRSAAPPSKTSVRPSGHRTRAAS